MEGAVLTVLLVIVMIAITASQFSNVINRSSQVLTTQLKYLDLSTDNEPFRFEAQQTNFQFAFYFTDSSGSVLNYSSV